MIAFLRKLFCCKTAQEKYADGERAASKFLAGNPSVEDMKQFWSSAHVDRDFSPNDDHFAKGAIEAMRPIWEEKLR